MHSDTSGTNTRRYTVASGDILALQVVRIDEVTARENLMTEERGTDRPEDVGNDWDLESAVRRPGVKQSSVVVSVRLRRSDFDKLSERAEAEGVPTSTFLRNAALEKIQGRGGTFDVYWIGGTDVHFTVSAVFGHTTSADLQATENVVTLPVSGSFSSA